MATTILWAAMWAFTTGLMVWWGFGNTRKRWSIPLAIVLGFIWPLTWYGIIMLLAQFVAKHR